MNKILYLDTETTGITDNAAIVQISGIVRIGKEVKEEFNFYIKPHKGADITDEALAIQKRTLEEINAFPDGKTAYTQLIEIFDKYIDKFDKNDKFILAGYNVDFDARMLNNFFKLHKNKYMYGYIGQKLDPLFLIPWLQISKKIPILENNKLGTWCNHFNIELEAHDSLEDIRATAKLINHFFRFLK
ncbi:MAG: 3'-5' exonuclease [Fusobacteriaceae bacterium]